VGSRWVKRHDEGDGQAREMRGRQGGWGGAGTCAVRVRVREGDFWVGDVTFPEGPGWMDEARKHIAATTPPKRT